MQEHLLVYQRAGEPCARCGRPIRRIVVGARATHFCSWCQRLPAADRKSAAAILARMTPRAGHEPGRARVRADRTRRAAAARRAAARPVPATRGVPA